MTWRPTATGDERARLTVGGRGCSRQTVTGDADTGMATVLACVCATTLVVVTALVVQLAVALLARHRAATAADLGALAGAAVVLQGVQAACGRAAEVTAANGAAVRDCTLDGVDVLLTVTVAVQFGPVSGVAAARARAGPIDPVTE